MISWLRVLFSRARALFTSRRLDRELEDELATHIEMEIEANVRRGMTLREARRAALREFGGVAQVKERYRERRGMPLLDALAQDVRYAWRGFARSPGFATVAVLSLALGIGAGTAVFTLLDQVLLRTLPVQQPRELVRFEAPGPAFGMQRDYPHSLSYRVFRSLGRAQDVFSGVVAEFATEVNLTIAGKTERAACHLVSGSYFQVLGIGPAAGRLLAASDDLKLGAHPVTVLGYDFWRRRFGGDPGALGRSVTINQTPMTVIGIAPPGFHGLDAAGYIDLIVPLVMKPQMVLWWQDLDNPTQSWLHVYARLRPGVSLPQAESAANVLYHSELEDVARNIKTVSAGRRAQFLARRLDVLPGMYGQPGFRQSFGLPLQVLMGLAGIVLLIACANLASLLSARSAARQSEFAIRLALGAGRPRLVRQLIVESLLLAAAGGVLALPLASWTSAILLSMLPLDDAARAFHTHPDGRILAFSIAVSLAAALLFGLAPALQATRPALLSILRTQTSASAGAAHVRFRKLLVAAEVALALVLTVAAGLFARTLYNLKSLRRGFAPENLILFTLDPTTNGYRSSRIADLASRIEERLRALRGVRGAAVVSWTPFNSCENYDTIPIGKVTGNPDDQVEMNEVDIGPGLFGVAGVPLAAGREFTMQDDRRRPFVAIVNESFARRFYSGNALGKRLPHRGAEMEIVGVVRDIVPEDPHSSRRDFVFTPLRQWQHSRLTFHVRTVLPPGSLFQAIRRQVREADPAVPIVDMKTMEVQADGALSIERLIALLSISFGLLALLLAAIGVYGVIAYTVAQRTREIGIRVALGAGRADVVALVMREIAVTIGAGLLIGAILVWPLSRVIHSRLFGVSATDPLTMVAAALLLAAIGAAAALAPARRATVIHPVNALRCQ